MTESDNQADLLVYDVTPWINRQVVPVRLKADTTIVVRQETRVQSAQRRTLRLSFGRKYVSSPIAGRNEHTL
jgi:hypothetical protein